MAVNFYDVAYDLENALRGSEEFTRLKTFTTKLTQMNQRSACSKTSVMYSLDSSKNKWQEKRLHKKK